MRTKDGIEIADETHFCFEFCQRFFFASFSFELKTEINKNPRAVKKLPKYFYDFFSFHKMDRRFFWSIGLRRRKERVVGNGRMQECQEKNKNM